MTQRPKKLGKSIIALILLSGCMTDRHHHHLDLKRGETNLKLPLSHSQSPQDIKPKKAIRPPSKPAISQRFKTPVTLTITESAPLKDIFLQLSKQARVDAIISPKIDGGLTFHAEKKPFMDIVKQICALSGLRYRIENDILRIEPDTAYIKSYSVQFLTLNRKNQNRISVATDVFSAVQKNNASGHIDNGSSTILNTVSENDFWAELERNLEMILQTDTSSDEDESSYTIHKQGGLISIRATDATHTQIQDYLDTLKKYTTTQVLIEAKILEVNLRDEFKSGINWQSLKGDFVAQAPLGRIVTPGPFNKARIPARDIFTIGGSGRHLTGLVSLIEKFGNVKTLSSPRMTVLNNQSSVLKVATNNVFFRIDYNRDLGYDSKREHINVSSEIQTVPIGLVMTVHPCINPIDGTIIMTLRPTISRIVGEKEDPAVSIVSEQSQQSFIPEVQVREMDSVLSMKSGEIMVMGGLMENRSDHENSGVPGASDIPLLGELFQSHAKEHQTTELVIFLKATIVDENATLMTPFSEGTLSESDQHYYDVFRRESPS